MFHTLSSKRGMTLIEVCFALFLLGIGLFGLISLQPSAWRLSGKSDYLGRAAGILVAQLQGTEASIMNPNITPTAGTTKITVYPSQQASAKGGDVAFTVDTTITDLGSNVWRVNVKVSWPGNNTGIKESMIVAQQQSFIQ